MYVSTLSAKRSGVDKYNDDASDDDDNANAIDAIDANDANDASDNDYGNDHGDDAPR